MVIYTTRFYTFHLDKQKIILTVSVADYHEEVDMSRNSNRKKMTPCTSKRMKPSTSKKMERPTSQIDSTLLDIEPPDEKLILYANPDTYELEKYNESEVKLVPDLGVLELHEFIEQIWFQDNTLLFEKLLTSDDDFILCVFPPGSGKSTIARLLEFYVSKNRAPKSIEKWLDNCDFQKAENDRAQADTSYQKFRGSSSFVLFIDFSRVQGETRSMLEENYATYIIGCWERAELPTEELNHEKELLRREPTGIWSSFGRLKSIIYHIHRTIGGPSIIILDSMDNMYNLIANLPTAESTSLCAQFTKGINLIIGKNTDSNTKTICFGVSPYLITEFQSRVFYSIADTNNEVGKYFSFSDVSIEKVIREWKLDVTKDQCKSVARFHYDQHTFVNPYLCLSYLKSLHDKSIYAVNISPRSLWMSCIFQEEDLKVLLRVLSSGERGYDCEFTMAVKMQQMCAIPQSLKRRELYYPLFVYGGFLSCTKKENKIFTLSASNETTKKLLKYHLELLFFRKFKVPFIKSLNILDAFLQKNFELFCVKLSKCYANISTLMMTDEMKYHCFMAGVFSHLDDAGFDTDHDEERCLIKPDSLLLKDNRVIINEYKHVKLGNVSKGARSRKSILKNRVVKECETIVEKACCEQIPKYASAIAAENEKNVDVNLILFYNIHIILLHCTYYYDTCKFSQYKIFASKGFYDIQDLNSIEKKCNKVNTSR